MRILLILLSAILFVACGSANTPAQPTPTQPQPTQAVSIRQTDSSAVVTASETEVQFSNEHVTLVLNKPTQWETFPTNYGVVIGEHFASVETAGVLDGLMAYAFVTPLSELSVNIHQVAHPAHAVLIDMLSDPVHNQNTSRSEVIPFEWDGYDAAYYLASDLHGNAMFVVSVVVPEQELLLTCTISAPYEQRDRIGEILPTLLNALQLNSVYLSGQPFEIIVDHLEFPAQPTPDTTF